MRFVRRGAAWWAVGALALAGCTGPAQAIVTETPTPTATSSVDPSPSPSPTPSTSTSATASPSPLTDEELLALMPEGADIDDYYGARVTAIFFLEQYGPMFQTGDTRVWDALALAACEYCANAMDSATEIRDGEWTVVGGGILPSANVEGRFDLETTTFMLIEAEEASSRVIDLDGETVAENPDRHVTVGLELKFDGMLWRIAEVAVEEGLR